MRRRFKAGWGWTGLAFYVAGYDTWALATKRDTLSMVFARAMHHPVRRWPVIATVSVTLLHLFGRLPTRIDPFHQYAAALKILDRARVEV
jgi:hypothetical protein